MAPRRVAGDLYFDLDGQLLEIKRQLRQREGYPYDPMQLVEHLQAAIEGKLVDHHGRLLGETTERTSSDLEPEVWRTIKRGKHTSADASKAALQAAGCRIDGWANDILERADFGPTETDELDLVVVSNADLGYPNGPTRQQGYERAQQLGLEKCPHWVGPALREEYKGQPRGECLLIGMKPITDSEGLFDVFSVERLEDDLWLRVGVGYPGSFSGGLTRWVFVRRKDK